jgi:hypothetical protein
MARTLTTAVSAAITLLGLSASQPALAQVLAYDHHSTAFGDFAGGAAELVHAQGQFLVNQSIAAQNWVQAVAARDQVDYQRSEYRFQAKQMELKYMQDRAEGNRQRASLKNANDEASARQLVDFAKRGGVQWPAALTQPKFAGSMTLVESILRNWSTNDPTGDAYRRALATEAAVLRTRVANDTSIDFASRVAAVRTLSQLQQLASLPAQGTAGAAGTGPQLAMR